MNSYKVLFEKTFEICGSNEKTLLMVFCKRLIEDFKTEPLIGDIISVNQTYEMNLGNNKKYKEHNRDMRLGVVQSRILRYGGDTDIDIHLERKIYKIQSETFESGTYDDVKNTVYNMWKSVEIFDIRYEDIFIKEMKKISDIIDILEKKKDDENQSS